MYCTSSAPYFDTFCLKISASSSDAGVVELRSEQPTQQAYDKGSEEQEVENSSHAQQLVGGKNEIVNGESNQEDRGKDSPLTSRKTLPTEGDHGGSVSDFQEPRKPPDDTAVDYLPPRVPRDGDNDEDQEQSVGSLDMDHQSSFLIDDDRDSPQRLLPNRQDRVGPGRLSDDDGSDLFSPQPFTAPEEELDVGGGIYDEQQEKLVPPRSHGDRCRTRAKQHERTVRGVGLRRVKPQVREVRHVTCLSINGLAEPCAHGRIFLGVQLVDGCITERLKNAVFSL